MLVNYREILEAIDAFQVVHRVPIKSAGNNLYITIATLVCIHKSGNFPHFSFFVSNTIVKYPSSKSYRLMQLAEDAVHDSIDCVDLTVEVYLNAFVSSRQHAPAVLQKLVYNLRIEENVFESWKTGVADDSRIPTITLSNLFDLLCTVATEVETSIVTVPLIVRVEAAEVDYQKYRVNLVNYELPLVFTELKGVYELISEELSKNYPEGYGATLEFVVTVPYCREKVVSKMVEQCSCCFHRCSHRL